MRGQTRQQPVALARQMCMAVARDELKMGFGQIGRCFGRTAHSARRAECTVRDLCETDAKFRRDYEWCKGEVEHKLKIKNAKLKMRAKMLIQSRSAADAPTKENRGWRMAKG